MRYPVLVASVHAKTARCLAFAKAFRVGTAIVACGLSSAAFSQAELTWDDNSTNEDGFNVERSEDGGAFVEIGQTDANVASYTDANVEAGVQYVYRVNAFNAYGVSGYTNLASHYINVAPAISGFGAVSINENESSDALAFTVSDVETSAGALVVTASSSNTTLIGASGISIQGAGSNRTVTLTPNANASGEAVVTLTVSDGEDVATSNIALTVAPYVFPTVSLEIDTFADSARAGEMFGLAAVVSDSSLVSSVSFSIDGQTVASDSAAPYEADVVVASEGTVTVKATAHLTGRSETVADQASVTVGRAPLDANVVSLLRSESIEQASSIGSAAYDLATDSITLVDDVGRIGDRSDTNRFHYVRASSDIDISARVVDLQTSSSASVAGLMLRSALYGKASQVSLLVDGDGRVLLSHRAKRAEVAQVTVLASASDAIERIRIQKMGTTISLWGAVADGEWTLLTELAGESADATFAGFALGGGLSTGTTASATFDQVEVLGELVEWTSDAKAPGAPTGLIASSKDG